MSAVLDRDALYYPYIQIRDVNWLKATLLCFPHVHRIVPRDYRMQEPAGIEEFRHVKGLRGNPLLVDQSTDQEAVFHLQERLLDRLVVHSDELAARYSFATLDTDRGGFSPYRIHQDKMLFTLLNFLEEYGLARRGEGPWLVMHADIGTAIMSTIALAIAQDNGLDVVTDSPQVHLPVLSTGINAVFDALLGDGEDRSVSPQTAGTVDDLVQLVMTTAFDVSKLSAAQIAELSKNGQDLREFKSALAKWANLMPEMQNPDRRMERLQQYVEEVIEEWERYRRSLPRFAIDALLGVASIAPPTALTYLTDLSQGASVSLIAASAGLAVGYVTLRGLRILQNYHRQRVSSPYRYLSQVHHAGATLIIPQERR